MKDFDQLLTKLSRVPETYARTVYEIALRKAAEIDAEAQRKRTDKGVVKQPHNLLASALYIKQTGPSSWQVGIDETVAPYARQIVFGTSQRVSRDFLNEALNEAKLQFNNE